MNNHRILVLDNGGDTVKFGWSSSLSNSLHDAAANDDHIEYDKPRKIMNVTSKLVQNNNPNNSTSNVNNVTTLVGDQVETILQKNPRSLSSLIYSTERGIITNLGNQIQVWKRIIDLCNIQLPYHTSQNQQQHVVNNTPNPPIDDSTTSNTNKRGRKRKVVTANSTTSSSSSFLELANIFGWKNNQKTDNNNEVIYTNQCSVYIGLSPYHPRSILEDIISIWLCDFQFISISFYISSVMASIPHSIYYTSCIIDIGWSATNIIPIIYKNHKNTNTTTAAIDVPSSLSCPIKKEKKKECKEEKKEVVVDEKVVEKDNDDAVINLNEMIPYIIKPTTSIRRLSIGGRHMINLLKYYYTYRQIHLMDDDYIIRTIFELTSYISIDFINDMNIAAKTIRGKRYYDLEYILPDYHTIYHPGTIQIPILLQKEIDKENQMKKKLLLLEENKQQEEEEENDDDDDEEDEDYVEGEDDDNKKTVGNEVDNDDDDDDDLIVDDDDMIVDDDNKKKQSNNLNIDEEEILSSSDDENEDLAIIQQLKREEYERKYLQQQQQQVLSLSIERYTIPEILFHPIDINLPDYWCNITQSIIQCISSCPIIYQPVLYTSIQLTGGLSKLSHIKDRLYNEIKSLMPQSYSHLLNIDIISSITSTTNNNITTTTDHENTSNHYHNNFYRNNNMNHDPIYQAWYGAVRYTKIVSIENHSIQRNEWFDHRNTTSSRGNSKSQPNNMNNQIWNKLFIPHGGQMI